MVGDPGSPVTHLIGIDCAAKDRGSGAALGRLGEGRIRLLEVAVRQNSLLPLLTRWIGTYSPALIALDAPLGWPGPLGDQLVAHMAGQPMSIEANDLFHRVTDRVVRSHTKKRPMEVGADKIARTALRAVNLLGELRRELSLPLSLAWAPGVPAKLSAIEVYPATTLRSRGLVDTGYKGSKPAHRARRAEIVKALEPEMTPFDVSETLIESDDALDAALCVLAAADFCRGQVVAPLDVETAKKEGWIWFRAADGSKTTASGGP